MSEELSSISLVRVRLPRELLAIPRRVSETLPYIGESA